MENNRIMPYVVVFLIITLVVSCAGPYVREGVTEEIIWYDRPAEIWEDALPLGNGRIGVMIFGGTSSGRIQLNDDSLWPADTGWDEPEGTPDDLNRIRELLIGGRYPEADRLMVEKFSRKDIVRSHQTLGDLFVDLDHSGISGYRRELDISRALASVSYQTEGYMVTQRAFVSDPHQAIVLEFTSDSPEGLNGFIRLERPDDQGYQTAKTTARADDLLVMEGEVTQRGGVFDSEPAPVTEGVRFETCLKVNADGGEVVRGDGFLELRNVRRAVLLIVSSSSFYHDDYRDRNIRDMEAVEGMDFDALLEAHVSDYRSYYSRVSLKLGDEDYDTIPTDVRLQRINDGATDPGLEALLFQYGRYLLISSSRPGTNPANLQGLWNRHIEAPWNADYHLNINLQMNYWPADVTNLSELNHPLFDYVDRLVENGKNTARINFGCRGAFIPHASDLWASTWLQARTAYWGSSFGAGGWLMQHYWHYFLFNNDTLFLRERAFPATHEVVQFYSDWLIEDPRDGTLISAPSSSPENRFIDPGGVPAALCLGSAVDQQTIAEVFDNYIKMCEILDIRNDLLDTVREQRGRLREGFVTGVDGRILEWDREYREYEPGHRHMSHLYGFHPGTAVTKNAAPELFEAVRKTLEYRLDHGGAGTGWSRAWLINCAARLMDGEMAHKHIRYFFRESLYNNLFDAHPPFQIDGNFGYTAGVAEMLLQSHEENVIRILPALPAEWKDGFVRGLKARGGSIIDIYWKDSSPYRVVIRPEHDASINLIYKEEIIPVELKKGKVVTLKPDKW